MLKVGYGWVSCLRRSSSTGIHRCPGGRGNVEGDNCVQKYDSSQLNTVPQVPGSTTVKSLGLRETCKFSLTQRVDACSAVSEEIW
jgi:hypothetical protein